VLARQLDHLAGLVQADMRAGDDSLVRVGIVPAVEPLPDQMPPGLLYSASDDVGLIETARGDFVTGPDGLEVDDMDASGERYELVASRRLLLGRWTAGAVFGAQALTLIDASRATLS
jgi:hypothetical protein